MFGAVIMRLNGNEAIMFAKRVVLEISPILIPYFALRTCMRSVHFTLIHDLNGIRPGSPVELN